MIPTNPITTRFSIWDEGEIQLFDTREIDDLYHGVKYDEMGLLLSPGSSIFLNGEEKVIVKINFLISGQPSIPHFETIQVVIVVKDKD